MANPQKENGFTAIANDIIERLIATRLNGTEFACILFLLRKTYGFHKKQDKISITQFEKALPFSGRRSIINALNNLKLMHIIALVDKGTHKNNGNLWEFNKNYDSWKLVQKNAPVQKAALVQKNTTTSAISYQPLVQKNAPTKETLTKETIQKKIETQSVSDMYTEPIQNVVQIDHRKTTNEIIELFEPVNPNYKTFYSNKTQRAALDRMLKEFGAEKLCATIQALPDYIFQPYAPKITTPLELEKGLGKLIAFVKSDKNKSESKQSKTFTI